jgi:flagellar FliL protein
MPPEEEKKEEKEKPKSKNLLIILIISAVLLGGGGAGGYFAYFKFIKAPAEGTETNNEAKKQEESAFYEMETFMVNLADPSAKRFLKATIKLKVNSAGVADECKSRNFEIRDMVLTLLTSKEPGEVISPEDKVNLKKEILASLNRVLRKGQVLEVYFTDFLVQ